MGVSPSNKPQLDAEMRGIIRGQAARLVGRAGFREDDREDLVQELTLHVLEQLDKFDPRRGKFAAFVYRVAANKRADLLRRKRSADRRRGFEILSLSERVPADDGEIVALEEAVPELAVPLDETVAQSVAAERALSLLPPYLRDLCERLKRASLAEIADELGLARTTLYGWLRKIGAALEAAPEEEL